MITGTTPGPDAFVPLLRKCRNSRRRSETAATSMARMAMARCYAVPFELGHCRSMLGGSDPSPSSTRGRGFERATLGSDYAQEFVPGFDKRLCAFLLKLGSQGINIDSGLGELYQHFFAVATVGGQD